MKKYTEVDKIKIEMDATLNYESTNLKKMLF